METDLDIRKGSHVIYKAIEDAINKKEPLLIGRFGTIECESVYWTDTFPGVEMAEGRRELLEKNAGVFPSDMESVKRWGACVKGAMCAADVLAVGWYEPMIKTERELLERWGWWSSSSCSGKKIPLRSLEPYYSTAANRWTRLLSGQSVCVVTSFAETARKQVAKGEDRIWPGAKGTLFPIGTAWSWVQTGYAPSLAQGRGGWECDSSPESWEEAIDWVVGEVVASGARIVLIGCGGLGMIIGARLRALGKICIVMGGAVQVFFGIKGGRWASHPVISEFWNSEWVWPSADETPRGFESVEGGCYWSTCDSCDFCE